MDFFIFALIILVASILQTSTGFGFAIMATPFLLLLFEPIDAIQINLILSVVISCALIRSIKNDIDYVILKRFIIGSAFGLPFGIVALLLIDMELLKLAVSIIIFLLTILLLLRFRMKQTKTRDFAVGGIAGALTTSIGIPGPPILLYFSGTDTQKEKLRATTTAFFLVTFSVSLLMQMIFTGTSKIAWVYSGYALPIIAVGFYFGQLLFKRINQKFIRIFTYVILLFTAIYLFFENQYL